MDEKIFGAIIGGLALILVSYLGAMLKFRSDLRFEYDKELRAKRIERYEELWRLTGLFPQYAREAEVTIDDVRMLTRNLRDWYFQSGMFLSGRARDAYFTYQKGLCQLVDKQGGNPTQTVEGATYEELRSIGSDLRTALVQDVGTRQQSERDRENEQWSKTVSGGEKAEQAESQAAASG